MKHLVILGAGGYGQTVFDIAFQIGMYDHIAFLDDNSSDKRVVGKCEDFIAYISSDTDIYPAFGNNKMRMDWFDRITRSKGNIPTIIHPTAYISPTAILKSGNVILPRAIVNTGVAIESGCIINCGAIVDHDCVLEKGVHIGLGAIVKSENRIPGFMKVDAGEIVENRKYPLNGDK